MIGKGRRDRGVVDAMGRYGAVYFGAVGGCGALIRRCIRSATVVAYEDLGAEAIYRLEVVDFPVTVIIDSLGNDLYRTGPESYLAAKNKE
jgi:fumarate hydratase subunit beta